jgi:hypothetical protein
MPHTLEIAMDWLIPLISLIGSAVAALLGAWAGARLALSRFKHERSFERRLQWHVEALRIIHELERQQELYRGDQLQRPPEFEEARQEFKRIASEAPAFMKDLAWRRLSLAEKELWFCEFDSRDLIREGASFDTVHHAMTSERDVLKKAQKVIISGLKELMPLEPDYRWGQRIHNRLRRLFKGIWAKGKSLMGRKTYD